jgi:hypothetical protein
MRLIAGIDILWRAHGQSQVGADPRIGVVLEGLSAPEQRALEAVPRSRTVEDFRRFAMVSGVPRRRADELLSLLGGSGVLTGSDQQDPGAASTARPDATTGDAQWRERRTLVGAPSGRGAEGDDPLREAIVVVAGLGRAGALTAAGLAAAGVGTIQLSDPAPVRPVDLLPYGAADVGHPRAERVAAQLHRAAPDVRLTAPARTAPDLVVHVTHRVVDPPRLRRLMQDDIPHLLVVPVQPVPRHVAGRRRPGVAGGRDAAPGAAGGGGVARAGVVGGEPRRARDARAPSEPACARRPRPRVLRARSGRRGGETAVGGPPPVRLRAGRGRDPAPGPRMIPAPGESSIRRPRTCAAGRDRA